jgi:hypothetical protein
LNVRKEPCTTGALIKTIPAGTRVKYEGQAVTNCGYKWYKISASFGIGWAASNWLVKPGTGEKNFNVTMIHQRFDVGDSFNGNWACGPTSATMAIAYFGKLAKKPIYSSKPHGHYNDYGWYISNKYTSPTGFVFDRAQNDPSGRPAQGAYGHCTENGLAWAWRIQSFCENHGLKTKFYSQATMGIIQQALNSNQLVILSTNIVGLGHIFLVKGYKGSTTIYANDPYGDATKPGYGTAMNGANVVYNFEWVRPKWMVTVGK